MQRALILIAASLASAHAAAETEVAFNDVPEAVRETAISTAPGVEFTPVQTEIEDGVQIYEFQATDHNGRHIEIDVRADGTLEEIEMEVALDDTPAAVLSTLDREAPGFIPSYIEMSVRDGGALVYEFDGELNGEAMSIEIAEGGELLVMSDGALS